MRNVGPPHLAFSFSAGTTTFFTTKILPRVGFDIPVNDSFQSCQNPINFKSGHSCSFQIYQTPGRRYASRQLLELTNVAFRDTKTLSAVGADVPFALRFRASKILSTLRADILVAFRATKHLEDAMLPVNCLN